MDILKEISTIKGSYYDGSVSIMEGLDFSQYKTIRQIEFYTNSKYLNGDNDQFNRIKPFYNIVNFRVNVAVKATDLDTKDIQVYSDNPEHAVKSMIFNKEVKNWMRETYFSKTLNEMNFTRAKYGGVLVKRVIEDEEIKIQVPEWKNLITDPVDIARGVKIEKHYLTPIEIQDKKDVWEGVNENWDTIQKVLKRSYGKGYTNSDRLCILEVEGIFPESYIGEESDDYCLQRHIILTGSDEEPIAVLHSEEKAESDYKYLPWLKASGRGLGIGVVEDGFHAQIATNDTILKERDIVDLASKTMFVTDSTILENNLLSDVQVGDIIKVDRGDQLTQLNANNGSLPTLSNILTKWDEQYSRISSTFEAITGETMPSGTPFRSIAIQNQEAQSTFNYRREEMGIFLNEIFTDWIIPHIAKKLNKQHILSSDFDDEELMRIDEAFSRYTAKKEVTDRMLNGEVTTQEEYNQMVQDKITTLRNGLKNKRYIDVPQGYFKDVEWKLDIITTGEQVNKSAMFETMSNIMTVVAQNPAILQDPVLKKIFSKIVELSGIGINVDMVSSMQPSNQPIEVTAPETVEQPTETVTA